MGAIRWMYAAVFARWNGVGELTPSALRTANVSSSPIRRSDPFGRRSFGAYTSIIGIGVSPQSLCGVLDHLRHLLRMGEKSDVARCDLRRLCAGALRVKALEIGIDRAVVRRDDVPRRNRLPRRFRHRRAERGVVQRLLYRSHHARFGRPNVLAEVRAELCAIDVEKAARVGNESGIERWRGELLAGRGEWLVRVGR